MPGGFGYPNYAAQRKTPSSEAVGAALMQQQSAPAEQGPGLGAAPMAPPSDEALREDGARRMTGAGQIDDNASDDDGIHSANAVNVAIGEALTRMGGGTTASKNPFKPRDRALLNLQQLGLSETEARLLIQTGGA